MKKLAITTKQYFLTLNLTYYIQAFSVLAFSLVSYFLSVQSNEQSAGDVNTWMNITAVILISGLAMSYFVSRLLMKRITQSMRLQEKMPRYARAILVRSALMEIPGLLAAVSAFITRDPRFLAVSMLIVVLFALLRPTKDNIAIDLNLSAKEKSALEDDQAVISEVNR
jgi:hypothetical protein